MNEIVNLNESYQALTPRLRITGGKRLSGEVHISGAKNSALVLMAASLLTDEDINLRNVPPLTDIVCMGKILISLGVNLNHGIESLRINSANLENIAPPYELVNCLRASFFCIGPLLARMGITQVPLPGGCRIGTRPVAEHIRGLKALNAKVEIQHGLVSAITTGHEHRLKGAHIQLRCPSVGATETLLMAGVLAEGETIITNAAQEPEVVDLIGLLIAMGAKVHGAGTSTLTLVGVDHLHGADYAVMPDRIEAGTFLLAAAITNSELRVAPFIAEHLGAVVTKLQQAGCRFKLDGIGIIIYPCEIRSVSFTTRPFPGFPTDLQAPFMSVLATATGTSRITEKIYENRFQHVSELQRMGASVVLHKDTVLIKGVSQLSAAPVTASDLRASAALILAGLAANGITYIQGLYHLDRGYAFIERKLRSVGASIERLNP
uniref:UDP-N-acetylglucosamine 1-carboxyvinyltransferase n=1 Tax=Paulinella chromatophora TaxID=39717 RepID=B1X3M4_PAUCH|nr:UDP-N-glucosamine 1-carboxyvinyltransferase [Paulinella chromatophora]ACB42543.1 UDP-N-glucosamine 1-carboxyvinyltransferase [Paulinella chromatophora]